MADKTNRLKARLPRGLADRGPAEIAATRRMIDAIRDVYERYGFEPVETPAIEYTDALGKFLPDQDRPNEGVFSFQDDDEQWLSLRYDLTAPLARYVAENFDDAAEALSQLSLRLGVPQREAGPGPLPPVHAVRRRHGGQRVAGGRRRDVHDGGRHDGGARHPARQLRGEGEQPQGARRRDGSRLASAARRMPAGGSPCCARSTSSIGSGVGGVRQLLGEGRKDESGDFTKGAGLDDGADRSRAVRSSSRQGADAERDACSNLAEAWSRARRRAKRVSTSLRQISQIWRRRPDYGDDRIRIDPSVVRGLEYYTGPVYEVELLLETKDEKGRPVRFGSVGGGGRYDGLVVALPRRAGAGDRLLDRRLAPAGGAHA